MKNKILLLFFSSILLLSCGKEETHTDSVQSTEAEENLFVPEFNADTAYKFVEQQVSFGPRVPNSPSHRKCGDYLAALLEKYGAEVTIQEFQAEAYNGKELDLRNIVGSVNPDAKKRILLAAHWDTRPYADQDEENPEKPISGANDGASGVAVLSEVLRTIHSSEVKPEIGIDIVFFDGEDYGQPDSDSSGYYKEDTWCLGSQYWSRNKHKKGYGAYYGILLDMVGGKDAIFAREGTSMHFAPSVVDKVWAQARAKGYGNFSSQIAPPITDDHLYVNRIAGIPMIDIIEYEPENKNYFGSYWHTHDDNLSIIDKKTLGSVGQTLLEVIYREK